MLGIVGVDGEVAGTRKELLTTDLQLKESLAADRQVELTAGVFERS